MNNHQNRSSLAGGLILIVIGLFFFLGEFDIIPYELYHSLLRWPTILVAIGIYYLFQRKYSSAAPLILIGLLFLMPHWLRMTFDNIWQFWPLILIAVGLWIILKPSRKPNLPFSTTRPINGDIFEISAILTSVSRQISSKALKGGMARIVLGGSDIYLIDSEPVAEGATIDLSILLGGAKIIVPTDWNVIVEVSAILGGVSDKRIRLSSGQQKTLRITGTVTLGGLDIVNA